MLESGMEEFGYEKLDVWQLSMELVDSIYEITKNFPKDEAWGLIPQMRRAAVSIPSNISEGYGLGGRHFAHHLKISLGSSYELRTQIDIARRQFFVQENDAASHKQTSARVSRMLVGLIRKVSPKDKTG